MLEGEAGVGKTALLGYLSDRVARWQVVRAVGVPAFQYTTELLK